MNTLDQLIADHIRLRDVLALLKHELAAGNEADLQLMQDIVTHYSEYFNRIHHPLEDQLFEYLLRRNTFQQHDAGQALTEHRELTRHTDQFLRLLDQALQGGIMPREALFETGWQFLHTNLDHMEHEERTAFTWAGQELTEQDWAEIGSRPVMRDLTDAHAIGVQKDCATFLHQGR